MTNDDVIRRVDRIRNQECGVDDRKALDIVLNYLKGQSGEDGKKSPRTINILGTEYELIIDQELLNENNADGMCQPYSKKIRIRPEKDMLDPEDTDEDKKKGFDQTLRHEIIHAFFYESGDIDCGDEKLVEWLSVQIPKMYEVFKEWNCTGEE